MKLFDETSFDDREQFEDRNAIASNAIKNVAPKKFHNVRLGDFKTPLDDLVRDFSKNTNGQTFLLSGPVGSGKSTLGFACMHERALQGLAIGEYLNARFLCPLLRSKQNFNSPESEYDFIMRMGSAPFLFYDEAGKADDKEVEWSFLSKVLSLRHDNELDSFIATNMDLKAFADFIKAFGKGDDIYTRVKTNLITGCLFGCHRKERVHA